MRRRVDHDFDVLTMRVIYQIVCLRFEIFIMSTRRLRLLLCHSLNPPFPLLQYIPIILIIIVVTLYFPLACLPLPSKAISAGPSVPSITLCTHHPSPQKIGRLPLKITLQDLILGSSFTSRNRIRREIESYELHMRRYLGC